MCILTLQRGFTSVLHACIYEKEIVKSDSASVRNPLSFLIPQDLLLSNLSLDLENECTRLVPPNQLILTVESDCRLDLEALIF
jgi:hypothetical protein